MAGPGGTLDAGAGAYTALDGSWVGDSSSPFLPAPPGFGPGFTDLSTVLDRDPPFPPVAPSTDTTGGMAEDPEAVAGMFGDVDGDGHLEVLISPTLNEGRGTNRTVHVYTYDPATGTLTHRGPLHTTRVSDFLQPMGVLDLDDDGHPDLLFNRPEYEFGWGTGAGLFDDPTPIVTRTGLWQPQYPTVYVDDLDGDGWLDLVAGMGNCCTTCREMRLYLRTGPRTFVDRTTMLADAPPGTSYAVMSADFGGERVLATVGQPCGGQDSPAFYHQTGTDPQGYPRFSPFDPIPPDAYIRSTEPPSTRNSSLSHWAPMGTSLADVNGDGEIDMAISLNFYPGVFEHRAAWPFVDWTAQFGMHPTLSDMGHRLIPWGNALVDLDQDGRPDLVSAHGNDHAAWTDPMSFVGPQFASIYWNASNFHFTEVTDTMHVGLRGQWKSLAVDDLDGDGDADLIVGGQGLLPRVYRNDIAAGNHGFSLRFHGSTSNPLGVGARVAVQVHPGDPLRSFYAGGMGASLVVSSPVVFVGLGTATTASLVRVTWPSGTVQELHDVTSGTSHTVQEPPLTVIDPPTRHAPANGHSAVTVRVTPRGPDGTVRTDAHVDVAVTDGTGTVSTPAHWTGMAWEATVTAPAASGSARLEVRVDGTASGIHPRLWWD